jgi:drug/metabolite transporter (DMT)-like permease
MLFSSLLSIIALPFILLGDTGVLEVGMLNIIILAVIGFMNVMVLFFYLLALQDEEASIAILFYQLVPVLALILGYFILGETITKLQFLAMSIVILGTSIIAFEIDAENNFKLRKKTAIYMSLASFFWALESVIFKAVALEENVWRSLFWEHVMLIFVGVVIFITMRSYRENFLQALKTNSKKILSLNVLNESLYMTGNILFAFAYLWAPIALILLVNSFQPIFVLAIGIFLTVFFPKITTEKIQAVNLWQKAMAIIITGIGTYLLFI